MSGSERPARRPAVEPRTVESQVTRMAGGEPEARPDPMVPLSTRVPESLRTAVRYAALDHDTGVQDIVTQALREWLARHQPPSRS